MPTVSLIFLTLFTLLPRSEEQVLCFQALAHSLGKRVPVSLWDWRGFRTLWKNTGGRVRISAKIPASLILDDLVLD